mgnify:CR=1 FL=1
MLTEVMPIEKFHLGVVLTVITGLEVSYRRIHGVYDLLGFMTGEDVKFSQVPDAIKKCKPHLIKQLPQLASSDISLVAIEFGKELDAKDGPFEKRVFLKNWLAEQVVVYGETFEVRPIQKLTK